MYTTDRLLAQWSKATPQEKAIFCSTGIGKHNTITLTYNDDEIEKFAHWETINHSLLHATYKWNVTQSFTLTAGTGINAQHYKSYFGVSRFWGHEYSPGYEKNAKTGSYNYTWYYLARIGWIYPLVTNLGMAYTLAPNIDTYCQAEFQMPWSSDDLYDLLYDYDHVIRRADGFNEAFPTKIIINAGIRYISLMARRDNTTKMSLLTSIQ